MCDKEPKTVYGRRFCAASIASGLRAYSTVNASTTLSLLYPHRHLSRKVRAFTEWLESLV
ncbi:hypothetical protein EKO15_05000 [Enterobacter bugandensis]|nr:hypothetical protein EKO15_05000 [Enterobacter bugandensis]